MTDITRYKNVSLHKDTYEKAEDLSSKLLAVKMSKSQVITLGVNLLDYLIKNNLIGQQPNQVSFQKLKQIQG
jgi:hypothetical protein